MTSEPTSPTASTTSLLQQTSISSIPSEPSQPSSPFHRLNIIVTGCTSLVGQAICHALASAGANLALTDLSKADGQVLCQEIQAKPDNRGSLLFSSFDPRDAERLTALVKSVTRTMKRLDGVVNCAMYSPEDMPFHSIKLETMTEMHDRNYKAVWAAMQAAITLFEMQNDAKIQHPKGGYAIVNVTSSFDTNDHYSAYQAARQAILGLTKATAVEYASVDIRINSVSVGAIEDSTPGQSIMNQIFTNMGEVKKQVPMQRAAKPEEIADAVLFLLGPGAAYITGADIPVDGGISAKRT